MRHRFGQVQHTVLVSEFETDGNARAHAAAYGKTDCRTDGCANRDARSDGSAYGKAYCRADRETDGNTCPHGETYG